MSMEVCVKTVGDKRSSHSNKSLLSNALSNGLPRHLKPGIRRKKSAYNQVGMNKSRLT
jgi:hypothetical protein